MSGTIGNRSAPRIRLRDCKCGREPTIRWARIAEDEMATWIECPCGERGGAYEYPYTDPSMAAAIWNDGIRP